MESLLLDGNGYWRSEQQGPEDEGVTVRELVLSPDGTLTYREGDWGSEYCYFAAGRWTVDERILSVTFFETGEDFAGPTPGAAEQAATFSVGFDREMLLLTQETETGFCLGRQGQTVYYFHPIE